MPLWRLSASVLAVGKPTIFEQLPEELKEPLQQAGEDNEEFSLDEFLRRVSEREDVDTDAVRNPTPQR